MRSGRRGIDPSAGAQIHEPGVAPARDAPKVVRRGSVNHSRTVPPLVTAGVPLAGTAGDLDEDLGAPGETCRARRRTGSAQRSDATAVTELGRGGS